MYAYEPLEQDRPLPAPESASPTSSGGWGLSNSELQEQLRAGATSAMMGGGNAERLERLGTGGGYPAVSSVESAPSSAPLSGVGAMSSGSAAATVGTAPSALDQIWSTLTDAAPGLGGGGLRAAIGAQDAPHGGVCTEDPVGTDGRVVAPNPGAKYGGYGSWIDRAFDLDPTKSFMESGMERLFSPVAPKEGDSQLKSLGKGFGAWGLSVAAPAVAAWSHLLDEMAWGPFHMRHHDADCEKERYEAWRRSKQR